MIERVKIGMIGVAVLLFMSSPYPAFAEDDSCPWGGDNRQALQCFQCMKREWTGRQWRIVNLCQSRPFSIFIPTPSNRK